MDTRANFLPSREVSLRICLGLAVTVVLVSALIAGCTSEDPNLTGVGLYDSVIDSVLIPLQINSFDAFGNLTVDDPEVPFDKRQVLYFGNQGTESSSLLARYDFSAIPDSEYPDSLFTPLNITKVELFLYMLKFYIDERVDGQALVKSYHVFELADTLDVSAYPGPDPAVVPDFLNAHPNNLEEVGAEIILDFSETKYLEWYEADGHTGIMITEGDTGQEVPGFIGFSSAELTKFTQLPTLLEGTLPFPVLRVTFADTLDVLPLRMVPMADVSTFDGLDPIPTNFANGIVVRTHLRSYPYFRYSLDAVPAHVFINRAIFHVVNDTVQSYGNLETLVLSQVDSSYAPGGDFTTTLQELENQVEIISARTNLDPGGAEGDDVVLEFTVTSFLQGHLNGTPDEPVTFALTAAEDFFGPGINLSPVDPAFYLVRFRFFGTADPDPDNRPYLKIVYTRDNDITGGG